MHRQLTIKRAARVRPNVAKAASISSRCWHCSTGFAAQCWRRRFSFHQPSRDDPDWSGSPARRSRCARAQARCSSSSCLAPSSALTELTPVSCRPAGARLATSPKLDRIAAGREDDRNCRGRRLGRQRVQRCCRRQSRSPDGEPARPPAPAVDRIAFCPAILDRDVLAFDVAQFAQALAKRRDMSRTCPQRCPPLRKPITGIAGCCARAASGHAPPRRRAA